jgi:hypothetical protein
MTWKPFDPVQPIQEGTFLSHIETGETWQVIELNSWNGHKLASMETEPTALVTPFVELCRRLGWIEHRWLRPFYEFDQWLIWKE